MKFGMETDHNQTKFYMKYCFQVNSYKHGKGARLPVCRTSS